MNQKSSAHALRAPKTNADVVEDIMEFSSFGALSQAFVMTALEEYSKAVEATPEEKLETGFMPAGVWKGIAAEVLAKLRAGGYLPGDADQRSDE